LGHETLTPREFAVLAELVAGESNGEIAVRLGIAERTVKNHLEHVYGKLGVRDRTQAVVRAISLGWFDPRSLVPNCPTCGQPLPERRRAWTP
jgi:DNA-binding NarL/FixJ family response regulator